MERDFVMAARLTGRELGKLGEHLAAEVLIRRGYQIVEANFHCRQGEIDLVARQGEDLVFVEVKSRRSLATGFPEEAVTYTKQRKLLAAANQYLMAHDCQDCSWRFDVVSLLFDRGDHLIRTRVYRHALSW